MRRPAATVLAAVMAFAAASPVPAADAPSAADLDTLLAGVAKIAVTGSPGSICCTAPEAFPLVAADHDKRLAAVAAATRLGKGRAVELGHNGYLGRQAFQPADTGVFLVNCIRWAAAGRAKEKAPRVGLRAAGNLAKLLPEKGLETVSLDGGDWIPRLGGCDVLVAEAGAYGAPEEQAALKAFLEGGGGLVTFGCPWGWAQVTGKDLRTEYPPNRLLGPAGLVAADTYVGPTVEGGFRVANPPERLLAAHAALDLLLPAKEGAPAPDKAALAQASHTVTLAARSVLPDDTRLLPRLRALVQEHGAKALPMPGKPVRLADGLARVLVAVQDAELRVLPPGKVTAHPAAKGFPYEVPADAKRVTKKIDIDTRRPDWHSTGLYAAPGETVVVTLPETAAGKGLGLRIGAHTDGLWHLDAWERWPAISWHVRLAKAETRLASPFGGAVYIEVPRDGALGTVAVQVANAVEAPHYVLGKTDDAEWKASIRNRPAPWAEMECPGIILTVPSKVVRTLDDPKALMTFWDRVVKAEDDLAGWKAEDRRRPERMVCDQQISAGYMHSGYPIMTFLDVIETNVNVQKITTAGEKGWGQWHELGHNHQDGMWTPSGGGEVTVNLFSLFVLNTVHGLALEETRPGELRKDRRVKKMKAYLASDKTPATWDPFTGLVLYYQLIDAFGWDAMKQVIAGYRDLPKNQRPRNDAEKWDAWMTRYAKAANRNLGPFFQKWKAPVSQAALDAIRDLPAWMHPDFEALTAQ
jgi:hypothetical protein